MRKIITTTFITLDGVYQAPGGPEEDTSNGFKYGGWSAFYWDDPMGKTMNEWLKQPFELLLGRKTYDIFASYWPTAKNAPEVAVPFNATKKYVVSHSPKKLSWHNSYLVTGDVVAEIQKLKKMDGPDLWIHGSGNLIQTLLKNHLIDRIHLWIFPVTVGKGKRLFGDDTPAANWKLIDFKTGTTGVIIVSYEPAGELKTGTVGE